MRTSNGSGARQDLLAALDFQKPSQPCPLGEILNAVEPAVRDRLTEIIGQITASRSRTHNRHTGVNAAWLAATLTEHGHPVKVKAAQDHCYGRCSCAR